MAQNKHSKKLRTVYIKIMWKNDTVEIAGRRGGGKYSVAENIIQSNYIVHLFLNLYIHYQKSNFFQLFLTSIYFMLVSHKTRLIFLIYLLLPAPNVISKHEVLPSFVFSLN